MSSQSRKTLRVTYRQRRRALGKASRRRAAQQLASHISRNPHFRAARRLAAYLATDGEIELQPALAKALQAGKQVYVPVLDRHGGMQFVRYRSGASTHCLRWGLAEPLRGARWPRAAKFDLVLMPLVAFDCMGHRIGRGGGHYDRYFATPGNHYGAGSRPLLMGVAHHFQQAPGIEAESWDVPLDAIATDRGVRYFKRLQ
ncbi:MAG: 5-formyltetrahydrofolate cyclo-ligase [Pseudomonadales bacterium]